MPRRRRPVRNPFDVLGVPRNADDATIKRAFRKLAAKHHPDRNPDPSAAETLKEVVAAWELLSDPVERRWYESEPTVVSTAPDAGRSARNAQPNDAAATAKPSEQVRPRPHRQHGAGTSATSSAPKPTPAQLAAFQSVVAEMLRGDSHSAGDVMLAWLSSVCCLMALLFYAFQGATAPFYVSEEGVIDPVVLAYRFEGHEEDATVAERVEARPLPKADFADRRFWVWMLIGGICVFIPGVLSYGLLYTATLVQRLRGEEATKSSWTSEEAYDTLCTGLRGCGVVIIWVIPNAWPWMIW